MTEPLGIAQSFLLYFNDVFYKEGVASIQKSISTHEKSLNNWLSLKKAIQERSFARGEPLNLLFDTANLPLDENTDEEAYKWLDKLVLNVEREDGLIDEY